MLMSTAADDAAASDSQSRSIAAQFLECEKFVENFDQLDLRQSSSKNSLLAALTTVDRLQSAVQSLSLFSTNESLAELSTGDLRFLLVPAYAAFLHFSHPDMDRRQSNLELAKTYFTEFIDLCESYKLLNGENENDNKTDSPATSTNNFVPIENIKDAAARRELKIKRHRESAQLQAQINQLRRLAEEDEEMSRRLYTKRLCLWLNKALQSLSEIKDELKMLEMRAKMADSSTKDDGEAASSHQHHKSAPFQTMILTRNNMQKQVFGAGYPAIATMTVDEWAIGRQAKMVVEAEQEQQQQDKHAREIDALTEDEIEEIERQRKMRMDLYTDDHRRGSGNMHNKG